MATAEQIIVAVSKHDEGAARAMIADCAEQYLTAGNDLYMGPVLDAVVSKLDDVRPGLVQSVGKSYVNGGAQGPVDTAVLEDLDALSLVCKASQTEHWVDRGGARHRIMAMRDERGRFSSKPGKGESSPGSWTKTGSGKFNSAPSNVEPQLFSEENTKDRGALASDTKPADEREIKEYLGRVKEVRSILQDLQQNVGRRSDLKLKIEFEDPEAHQVTFNTGQDLNQVEWDLGQGAPDRYSAVTPKGMDDDKLRGVAQAMGAGDAQGLGMKEVRHYANELLSQKDLEESGANKAQRLIGAGSQLADLVGMKGLSGALSTGAQALRVSEEMRPTLARAAYRYRGTERVPEKNIVEAAAMERVLATEGELVEGLKRVPAGKLSRDSFEKITEYADGTQLRDRSVVGALLHDRLKQFQSAKFDAPISNQRLTMAVQRDRVGQELLKRIAQREASGASQVGDRREGTASMNSLVDQIAAGIGRGLPSEGVLIDDSGVVVAQSVGMGGDNYQPFTAAALGKLSGGQYVRTRNSGGISPDDVRTLLISGGRAGMVVSPAGVFDLEFDPRFRGTKRFSDKALQMIDTYTRILDQLAAKNIYAKDLPADVETEVAEEAVRMSGVQRGQDGYKHHYDTIRDAKRLELSRITSVQRRKFREEAEAGGGSELAVETRFKEMVKTQVDENVRALSLNGEGYAVALRTLQEFYPYWVRGASRRDPSTLAVGAAFDPRTASVLDRMESGSDKEYVAPGNVRAGSDAGAADGRPRKMSVTVDAEKRRDSKKDDEVSDKKPSPGGTGGTGSGVGKKPVSEPDATEVVSSEGPPIVAAIASGGKKAIEEAYSKITLEAGKALDETLKNEGDEGAEDRVQLLNTESDDGSSTNSAKRFERDPVANGRTLVAAISDAGVFKTLVDKFKSDPDKTSMMVEAAVSALGTETKSEAILSAVEAAGVSAKVMSGVGLKWEKVNSGFSGSPQMFEFLSKIDNLDDAQTVTDTGEYQRMADRANSPGLDVDIPISDQVKTLRDYRKFLDFIAENASEFKSANDSIIELKLNAHGNQVAVREIVGTGSAADRAANLRRIAQNPGVLEDRFKAAKAVFSANYLKSMAGGLGDLPLALAPLGLNKEGEIQKSVGEDEMVDFSQMSVEEVLEMMDEMKG